MSSRVRSGKSRRISSSDVPEAQVLKDLKSGDAQAPYAGFPTPFPRLYGDDPFIAHGKSVWHHITYVNRRTGTWMRHCRQKSVMPLTARL